MAPVRTFIALPTSPAIQQSMVLIQEKLKSAQADVKWESPEKFHITLKFLGNVEPTKIDALTEILAERSSSHPSFDIFYELIGTFPNLHMPRVIWIGTKSSQDVLDLQTAVEQACADLGFAKDNRSFHPHITLGRVKSTHNLARLTEAIKNLTFEPILSRCTEIVLMKSDLHPRGSIYTILKSFSLQHRFAG